MGIIENLGLLIEEIKQQTTACESSLKERNAPSTRDAFIRISRLAFFGARVVKDPEIIVDSEVVEGQNNEPDA